MNIIVKDWIGTQTSPAYQQLLKTGTIDDLQEKYAGNDKGEAAGYSPLTKTTKAIPARLDPFVICTIFLY